METPGSIHLVYFSPTGGTRRVLKAVAKGFGAEKPGKHDITQGRPAEVCFGPRDLVLFGVPVYAGRVPGRALEALNRFKGDATPAVGVVVYGNRAYDDALLELKTTLETNGFRIISLGAFVAEHAIFPTVAHGRPDKADKEAAKAFGRQSLELLQKGGTPAPLPDDAVKGHFPYKEPKPIPLAPKANRRCNACGTCVKKCPTGAIHKDRPRKTDAARCIACARCIAVCPRGARRFKGLVYKVAAKKFTAAYRSPRLEPETIYAAYDKQS